MTKKITALLLAGVMALSLSACGTSKQEPAGETPKTTEAPTQAEPAGEFYTAMVADTGGVNDQSFNQSAWEGLQAFGKSTGAKVSFLESKQASDYASNFDKLADEGANLIWGIGFTLADALSEASTMNPEQMYGIVDFDYGENTPDNVACTTFNVQDSSFLVGYIAGLTTKTNRVGYIGGMKSPTMDLFEYGYRAGVAYAAKELGKKIDVDVQFAESFTDAAKGKAIAASMYSAGSDIIFHAAGGVGVGAIEQAVEEGKWVIGVDRDQSYLAPKNVLTSALKIVSVATEELSKEAMKGTDIGGKTFKYGLAEGAVGIPKENPNMDPKVYEKAMEIEKLIRDEAIVAPYNEATFTEFSKGL